MNFVHILHEFPGWKKSTEPRHKKIAPRYQIYLQINTKMLTIRQCAELRLVTLSVCVMNPLNTSSGRISPKMIRIQYIEESNSPTNKGSASLGWKEVCVLRLNANYGGLYPDEGNFAQLGIAFRELRPIGKVSTTTWSSCQQKKNELMRWVADPANNSN